MHRLLAAGLAALPLILSPALRADQPPAEEAPTRTLMGSGIVIGVDGACVIECETDAQCSHGEKCYDNGCGRTCMDPNSCSLQGGNPTGDVNELLDQLTPALNQAWPAIATQEGLDPWKDVWSGKIDIGCKNGGDEICAVELGACDSFYVQLSVDELTGLAGAEFYDLALTVGEVAEAGGICQYDDKVHDDHYTCGYSGQFKAKARLDDTKLKADIGEIKVKVKCESLWGSYTTVLYSGSADCTASQLEGTGVADYCGGSCISGTPHANFAYLGMDSLDLGAGSLSCDVKPDYDPVSWIAEIVVPELEDEIIDAVTPPIRNALDDLLESLVPFPSGCQ